MEITPPRQLVERFYYDVWNKGDEALAREILDPGFRFRGSLGPERIGSDGFIDYMRAIRMALADFECIIDDLIEGEMRVAARMQFRGIHSGEFFGVPATGQEIVWSGAAFFTMDQSSHHRALGAGGYRRGEATVGRRRGVILRSAGIVAKAADVRLLHQ